MNIKLFSVSLLAAVPLAGCASLSCTPYCHVQERNASSLVNFLYPEGVTPPAQDVTPQLHLPLRVGLAFLPQEENDRTAVLDEAHKDALLEGIRQRFLSRKFVREIVIVPDYYLASSRGPEGLQAIQRLYGVDLIALVSYDQVAHRDDNEWSLGYLTIVGAYVLKGTRQDVATLVDLAVVDPGSRSLVLRAGGSDTQHANSTLVGESREGRQMRTASFDTATGRMISNFDAALTRFEAEVREGRSNVRVVHQQGGGGATDPLLLILLGVVAAVRATGTFRRVRPS
jgi:rhombotail lipoprotein